MDNNFSAYMLADQTLRAGPGTLDITVRLPWYRSLPLSTVEVAKLRVDGQEVPANHIGFEINGHSRPMAACADQINEWWYVLDDAIVHAAVPGLENRPEHLIEITLNLYPPYMPGFTWVTQTAKHLKVTR